MGHIDHVDGLIGRIPTRDPEIDLTIDSEIVAQSRPTCLIQRINGRAPINHAITNPFAFASGPAANIADVRSTVATRSDEARSGFSDEMIDFGNRFSRGVRYLEIISG